MTFHRTIARDRGTHTWEDELARRAENGGLGCCNTGSGKPLTCALGGIGCDVDHISIAKININPSLSARPPSGLSEMPTHTEVWIRADTRDGNYPLETTIRLAGVPRQGDLIEVWNAKAGSLQRTRDVECPTCHAMPGEKCFAIPGEMPPGSKLQITHPRRLGPSGEAQWLEVENVVWNPSTDEDPSLLVEVWVRSDTYDLEELRGTIEAAGRGDRP